MKALGVVRKVDELGRIVVPVETRRQLGWSERQPVEMFMDGDCVIMKAADLSEKKEELKDTLIQAKAIIRYGDDPELEKRIDAEIQRLSE